MRALAGFLLLYVLWSAPAKADEPLASVPYSIAYGGRMSADVMIDGQGPFHLLIDTGSSQTLLFLHTATALSLLPVATEKILVHSIADTVTSPTFELDRLDLGGETLDHLRIAVIEDADNVEGFPDGILGIDVLEHYAVVFDHPNGRMLLFPRRTGVPAPYNSWRWTDLNPRRLKDIPVDFWFFDARYGMTHATTLLDLGTAVTILTWELSERLVPHSDMPRKTDDKVRDALGKDLPAFRLENLDVTIARHNWYKQVALVTDAPVFDFLGFKGEPAGIVGPSLLKDASFAIDFENHRLYVGPHS